MTIHSFYHVNALGKNYINCDRSQSKPYLSFSEGDLLQVYNKDNSFFDVSFYKKIALITTLINLIISLVIFILFDLLIINFNLYKNIII